MERVREKGARDKVTKRRTGKERVEWGREALSLGGGGLYLYVCAVDPRVSSSATAVLSAYLSRVVLKIKSAPGHACRVCLVVRGVDFLIP